MIYKQPPRERVLDEDMTLDGISVRDIQAAIQAAWRAEPAFAKQLAERYGIYDMVCLRCAAGRLAVLEPTEILKEVLGALAYQLCVRCLYAESYERTRHFVTSFSNPCREIWIDYEQQDEPSS